ncbi:MAG: MFS transporter [Xanthobacteraceae bacterium]
MTDPARSRRVGVVAIVATLGAAYIASMFLRNSVGVLAPDLAQGLSLAAPQIALVSSIYFIAFVAAQIPIGVVIDRYGPKRCMLVCAVVTVASTLLFAGATNFATMVTARVLMGLGTSCFLMAPLALYARTFPPDRFALLTGIQLGVGALGGMIATAPLAYASAAVGWRASFALVAGATAVIALLILALIHNDRDHRPADAPVETLGEALRGVAEASRCPDVGRLFVLNLTAYSSYVLVVGLWGGPYLTHVYGFSLTERGTLLFIPALTQVLGMMAWGASERLFRGYKLAVYLGSGSTTALLLIVGIMGRLPEPALWAWFVAFGACAAFTPVVIAHGKALFPLALVGRGMTLLNMGFMGGGFVSQLASGYVINLFSPEQGAYPTPAYQAIFLLQAGFSLLGLMVYHGSRDPKRK